MAESKTGSQAVIRALRLLKLFNSERTTLTTNEAVALSGLNRTTAFRLLTALEDEGFLERGLNGGYHLGPVSIALGSYALQDNLLQQVAQPFMQELVAETGERATLEILSRDATGRPTMLVVEEIGSNHRLGVHHFFGNYLPLHATSTGKVILAHMPPDKPSPLTSFPLERLTQHTLTTKKELEANLDRVREVGYAIATQELELGLVALAAPIFAGQKAIRGAICLTGPTVRLTPERISVLAEKLVSKAAKISSRLGYQN